MNAPLFINPVRSDPAGDGGFQAPRGSYNHTGIDYQCIPGAIVCSPVAGQVTKIGYAYGSGYGDWDPSTGEGDPYRYVEITSGNGRHHHRLLYVDPTVAQGAIVVRGTQIGIAQDVTQRYPGQGMLPHVHYEVYLDERKLDNYVNPDNV